MKIRSMRSRAAIAVATAAILATGLSGTGSAATGGPAAQSSPTPAVPAPYLGDPAADPAPGTVIGGPPAPSGTDSVDACNPTADGDYVHRSDTAPYYVRGHGWWHAGTGCGFVKTTVWVDLYEHYSDGTWRFKATGNAYVYPGGGAGRRATVTGYCESFDVAGWRTLTRVYIGSGDLHWSPGVNRNCQIFS